MSWFRAWTHRGAGIAGAAASRGRIVAVGVVASAVALGVACSSAFESSFDRNLMLSDLANHVIVPIYADFETRSGGLSTAMAGLCAAPDQGTLDAAQQAWADARMPWKRSQAFAFGPMKELRTRSAVDWWPIDTASIAAVLADTASITQDYISTLGAGARGMLAIEYLLWDPEGGDAAILASLTAGDADAARRCEYLNGLALYIQSSAAAVVEAWRPAGGNYAGELAGAGQTSTVYSSSQAAINDLVNYLIFEVEEVAENALGRPLGKKSGGTPLPDEVEAARSDNALTDILDELRGVQDLYLGRYGEEQGVGLTDLVKDRKEEVDAQVRAEIDDALSAVTAIPGPLEIAVVEQTATVELAYDRVKALQTTLTTDVAALLGVTLTFNDNDGD